MAVLRDIGEHKKYLKKYITSMTDAIGYVVGLAVIHSSSSGQMYGQPLPIHCQINAGSADKVVATAEFSINRMDFDLKYPGMSDDLIRKEVVIKLNVAAPPAK